MAERRTCLYTFAIFTWPDFDAIYCGGNLGVRPQSLARQIVQAENQGFPSATAHCGDSHDFASGCVYFGDSVNHGANFTKTNSAIT